MYTEYENLFTTKNKLVVIDSLADFLKLPKTEQTYAMVSDRALTLFPIKECNEPLLPLSTYLSEHHSPIQLVAGQADYGAQSLETQCLRVSAAKRLLKAEKILKLLNPKLTFRITDSYRPINLQKKYYEEISKRFAAQGLTGDQLYLQVVQVISDPACHPPHCTGGTLDLMLIEETTKQAVDMGSKLDDVGDPQAATFHNNISSLAKKSRLTLYTAMIKAGFVNSPSEWWHYTYGTQEWAVRTGHDHAFYDTL